MCVRRITQHAHWLAAAGALTPCIWRSVHCCNCAPGVTHISPLAFSVFTRLPYHYRHFNAAARTPVALLYRELAPARARLHVAQRLLALLYAAIPACRRGGRSSLHHTALRACLLRVYVRALRAVFCAGCSLKRIRLFAVLASMGAAWLHAFWFNKADATRTVWRRFAVRTAPLTPRCLVRVARVLMPGGLFYRCRLPLRITDGVVLPLPVVPTPIGGRGGTGAGFVPCPGGLLGCLCLLGCRP